MEAFKEMVTISKLKAQMLDLLECLRLADDFPKELAEQKIVSAIRDIQERENFLLGEL